MSRLVHDLLVKARELIKDEENWCKNALAKNKRGNLVSEKSDDACSFCMIGAVSCAGNRNLYSMGEVDNAIDILQRSIIDQGVGVIPISVFNDGASHKDVIKVFDHAIEKT